MPILKFNPYHAITIYSADRWRRNFPLLEGEQLLVDLEFSVPIPVVEIELREDLEGIEANLEVMLVPRGKERGKYLVIEVMYPDDIARKQRLLSPLEDLWNCLVALTTEMNDQFPFEPGQLIRVPVTVAHLQRLPYIIFEGRKWVGLLAPEGESRGGLIHSEVEIIAA